MFADIESGNQWQSPTRVTIPHVHAGMQGADLDPRFSLAHNLSSPRNWLLEPTMLQGFALNKQGNLFQLVGRVERVERDIKQHLMKNPREGTQFKERFRDRCPKGLCSFIQDDSGECSHLIDKVPGRLCAEVHNLHTQHPPGLHCPIQ